MVQSSANVCPESRVKSEVARVNHLQNSPICGADICVVGEAGLIGPVVYSEEDCITVAVDKRIK